MKKLIIASSLFMLLGSKCYSQSITSSVTYCNDRATYTIKINGQDVIIYYTDLEHLDRNSTSKGYIKNNKIYIKVSPTSIKDVAEFGFDKKHQLLMFDYNKKAWITIKPCEEIAVNQSALYRPKTFNDSAGKRTINSPGNQGVPNYNTSGKLINNGLIQRNFIVQPIVNNDKRLSGTVVVRLVANKNGDIIFAHAGEKGTTITDSALLKSCEIAVKQAKVNSSTQALEEQTGLITFRFNVY